MPRPGVWTPRRDAGFHVKQRRRTSAAAGRGPLAPRFRRWVRSGDRRAHASIAGRIAGGPTVRPGTGRLDLELRARRKTSALYADAGRAHADGREGGPQRGGKGRSRRTPRAPRKRRLEPRDGSGVHARERLGEARKGGVSRPARFAGARVWGGSSGAERASGAWGRRRRGRTCVGTRRAAGFHVKRTSSIGEAQKARWVGRLQGAEIGVTGCTGDRRGMPRGFAGAGPINGVGGGDAGRVVGLAGARQGDGNAGMRIGSVT